jgi:hypothetical protein
MITQAFAVQTQVNNSADTFETAWTRQQAMNTELYNFVAANTIGEETQAWSANLDTYATITPSANMQAILGAETYAAIRVLLNIGDGADVTDTANVTAAGALMDSEVANLAEVKAFDSTDYATAAQGVAADTALQTGDTLDADDVAIDDAGGIITATDVEAALQENRTAIDLNTAKTTNATHTGEVTGSGALTIANNIIEAANLESTNSATDDYIPSYDSASGGFTWVENAGGGGTDDQTASEVNTSTANFDGNLSAADTTVQAALETLDELAGGSGTDDQQITEFTLTGDNLTITLESDSGGQQTVDLSGYDDSGTDDQTASEVSVTDAGGLTTQTDVEAYLAENRTAINLNTAKVGVTVEEQNVNADWDSSSGDSEILNKPTIPTASSLSVDDLITLSGVAEGATNLGTFTGTTISDSQSLKQALQALETAVEGAGGGGTDDQNIESMAWNSSTNTLTVGIEDGNSDTVVFDGMSGIAITLGDDADTTEGKVGWDATLDRLEIGDGAAVQYFGSVDDTAGNGDTNNTYSADKIFDELALKLDATHASDQDAHYTEAQLEALLELQDLQGAVTDAQVPDTITASNYSLTSHDHSGVYEPADAAIAKTDEAETLSANWVNTANPWADNEVADDITAGTAATLATARTIGGVSFDGSANINLPGVNTTGNQDTAGTAAEATALAANGANCSAGSYPLGVDASGAAEGCTDATTEINSAIATAASNYADAKADTNTIQFAFNSTDLGAVATEPAGYMQFEVPVAVEWTTGELVCDGTITSASFTVGSATAPYGTFSDLTGGGITSTGAVTVTGWTDPTAGTNIGAWVDTASTGDATSCKLIFTLVN